MKINFEYHDVAASETLEDYTQTKIDTLLKRSDRITAVDVYFRVNDAALPLNRMKASIRLELPGETLFAESLHKSFQQSVAESVEELKVQLEKYKAKIRAY